MSREADWTLVFLSKHKEVLLGYKKRGNEAGFWNGAGGKVEKGESSEAAMLRNCLEVIAVTPEKYRKIAQIAFRVNTDKTQALNNIGAYLCESWQGEPAENEEMRPEWFSRSNLPYREMWPSDEIWLPLALTGGYYEGEIETDSAGKIKGWKIEEIRKK